MHRRVQSRVVIVSGCAMLIGIAAAIEAVAAPPTGYDAILAPSPRSTTVAGAPRSDEREAARLLVEAEAELAQGDPRVAARLLELMVARYPATLAAERARGRLEALQQAAAGAAEAARKAQPGGDLQKSNPQPPVAKHDPIDAVGGWRTRIRPTRTAGEEFRDRAGDRVFFGEGSAELGSRARTVLAAQAAWLRANPEAPVVVEAHADDPGTPQQNAELAARRGEAVKARLVEEGIAAARIRIAVIGLRGRVATCPEPMCAAQNRRVVTLIAWRSPLEGQAVTEPDASAQPVAAARGRRLPPGMTGLGGPPAWPAPR